MMRGPFRLARPCCCGYCSRRSGRPRRRCRRSSSRRPRPAQDEFVPVDELPPQEQLPAAPLLIAAYSVAWIVGRRVSVLDLAAPRPRRAGDRRGQPPHAAAADPEPRAAHPMGDMTAAHFIFIPAVLLVGIVIGWILGSRAAHDALAAELRRREERAAPPRGIAGANPKSPGSQIPRHSAANSGECRADCHARLASRIAVQLGVRLGVGR